MRKYAFLAVVFVAVLICVSPVLADNDLHDKDALMAESDGCAGCHRAHTAQGPKLLKDGATQDQFCFTCHDGSGAETDVVDGILVGQPNPPGTNPTQYGNGDDGDGNPLRGGGFAYATMDTNADGVLEVGVDVTSAHSASGTVSGRMWGSGPINGAEADYGITVELRCGDCHNPHGNGNYRILRGNPNGMEDEGNTTAVDVPDEGVKTYEVTYNVGNGTDQNYRKIHYVPEEMNDWCAQCHTRYSAGIGAGNTDSGDAVFMFRHNTGSLSGGCLRCHVAHGTSATMGTYSGAVTFPDGTEQGLVPAEESRLLSNNNRKVCAPCHTNSEGEVGGHGGDGNCAGCHGATGSHATHTTSNGKGPHAQLGCLGCHNESYNGFRNGQNFDNTDVCDPCHSPGGTYNGVESVGGSVGAKNNWQSGIYDGDALQPGKEKWCAGCHDEEPANSKADETGVPAPSVVGDEDASTDYGTGYGFYKTGHGLSVVQPYPASGRAGAGLDCLDCHDTGKQHIDDVARTYEADSSYLTYAPESAGYQDGYRLMDVATGYDGTYPMHIPRTGHVYPPGFREDWEFALCFQCHDSDALLVGNVTNFRDEGAGYNSHDYHTSGINGPFGSETPQWDSDVDGVADSRMTCPSCHNVHGSPSPVMIRHGELISTPGTTDKVPSLGFQYTPEGTYPVLTSSTGGMLPLIGGGPGTVAKNGVCDMCHADTVAYPRTPPDSPGPNISNQSPGNGDINIAVDSDITFTLSDGEEGVDWTTFTIQLSGDLGYSQTYTDEDTLVVSKTGTAASYDVTVNPDADFGNGEVITVAVNVDDLAVPANAMPPASWSFATIPGGSGTVTLHPYDVASNPGGYAINSGDWTTALDSNDGDATYAHRCCAPPGFICYVDMDDPEGLEGTTIDSITIYAYARCVVSPGDSSPAAGSIDIGYKTGTATIWKGDTSIDTTGNYNLIVSSTFTTDSDGGGLDLGDITNLQVGVERIASGSTQLRVTEIYVEVDYTP